jgi:hypothetical protein
VPESAPGCIIATITRSDRIFMPQLDRVRAVLRTLQLQVCYTDIKVASSASTLRNTIRVKSRDFLWHINICAYKLPNLIVNLFLTPAPEYEENTN